MNTVFRGALAAIVVCVMPACALTAQGWTRPGTPDECEQWSAGLAAGGQRALDVVTYGNIAGCPATAPGALAEAIRGARASRDTAYLGRLAAAAGQVRDPEVFGAALEVAADGRASDRSRVAALLVTIGHLGSSQYVSGRTRPQLFTDALPASGICGFEIGAGGPVIDNPIPGDVERRAVRVFDGIVYSNGQPALVQNLARCARSVVGREVPPQVDTGLIKLDYVCGNRFRVQNHTGAAITLTIRTVTADGLSDTEDVTVPAIGGWTSFTTPIAGTVQLSYDGEQLATVPNSGRRCGG
jgi:hypothetical protein